MVLTKTDSAKYSVEKTTKEQGKSAGPLDVFLVVVNLVDTLFFRATKDELENRLCPTLNHYESRTVRTFYDLKCSYRSQHCKRLIDV